MNVRSIAKWLLIGFAALLVAVMIGGYAMYRYHVRTSGLEAAQQWARMAPLPDSASGLVIETRGGPFTREFTIRFNAPSNDVNSWLDKSPGTSELKPVVNGNIRVYTVEPGGGAMHAEVMVDDDLGSVSIHTFWS
ncbi:hypothetical protein Q31b_50330 [Novipirellula aureliae]|uniref:Uncharacterized protein n=1 Tax=Novipirellula aureliae TaxID=2527966 RepID=A0A5C6DFV8_9BACT|nr:hypothetical protein [Novipirellula aureliae]TWU35598.1 hypothetical protein Q31b_50330 [Novipirellula aureliae]